MSVRLLKYVRMVDSVLTWRGATPAPVLTAIVVPIVKFEVLKKTIAIIYKKFLYGGFVIINFDIPQIMSSHQALL